jgi:hypothetical protein
MTVAYSTTCKRLFHQFVHPCFMQNTCVHLGPFINDVLYANTLRSHHMSNRERCARHTNSRIRIGVSHSHTLWACQTALNSAYVLAVWTQYIPAICYLFSEWCEPKFPDTWTINGQLYQPQMTYQKNEAFWLNENWHGKLTYSEKICTSAALSTINPTWTDLGLNLGYCNEKPAANHLITEVIVSAFGIHCHILELELEFIYITYIFLKLSWRCRICHKYVIQILRYCFLHLNTTTLKISFTFTVHNEFIGHNGMAVCYMFPHIKPSLGGIH